MGTMAANETTFVKIQRSSQGFTALSSAVCEWFLIFLLFIDASLSYLLTKFARYCELPAPCLLCSRLDHVLGNEKPEFYRSLLCSNHRSEVSSLISCQIHGKLADAYKMCEECLLSFTTKNKPNPEMHRLLAGKLGVEHGGYGFQSPLLNRDFIPGSMTTRLCSCCSKPWRSRQSSQRLFQLRTPSAGVTKPNLPLPRLPSRRLNRRDSLKKIREKYSESVASTPPGKKGFDPLCHVGYTELKITSDSESEFPFSDDDDGSSIVRDKSELKEDFAVQCDSEIKPKTQSDDLFSAKPTHQASRTRPPILDTYEKHEVSESVDVKSSAPDVSIGCGFGDQNWHDDHQKMNRSDELPELISLDDIPSSSSVVEVSPGVLTEKYKLEFPLPQNYSASALSELVSLPGTPQSDGASPDKSVDATGVANIEHVSVAQHGEVEKSVDTTIGEDFKADQVSADSGPLKLTRVDASDVCESVASSNGREGFSLALEKPSIKDFAGVNEDSKLLLSPHSSAQMTDLSLNNTSPEVHGQSDELEITDASNSSGIEMLQNSLDVERLEESGSECLDGSVLNEIESENVVDQLKQHISDLYKDLEEERNASTIAANQAMAMITRLQEEKAALHMEALQYLRMMEEQAEHDLDALEKANDLLAEKEKDIQDLEAEIEFYRLHFPDEPMVENIPDGNSELKRENVIMKSTSLAHMRHNSMSIEFCKARNEPAVKIPWLEFKDEKLYISQCLESLESKLHQLSCEGTESDMPDSKYSRKDATPGHCEKELPDNVGTQFNCQIEEGDLSPHKESYLSTGRPSNEQVSNASVGDDSSPCEGNNNLDANGQNSLAEHSKADLVVALENEISDLNDRLETLEANQDFLEHTLASLQNGNEGLQFVQEIAHQLQELRNIGIRIRSQSVP